MNMQAIILAAGKGTRMKTPLPKCIYPFFGKPMIRYIVDACKESNINDICVVIGHQKELIEKYLQKEVVFAYQDAQLGTAHALLCASNFFKDKDGITLILPGDMPLINKDIINKLINYHFEQKWDLTILTTLIDKPTGYGRIIRNNKQILKIIEEKDASEEIKKIKEVNTSVYCINNKLLLDALLQVNNHNQKQEYYLTDIVEVLAKKYKVGAYLTSYDYHLMGINDLDILSQVEKYYQQEINKKHMLNGVRLINPDSIIIEDSVKIDTNVTIDAFSILRGNTTIVANSYIKPYSLIIDNEKIN